MFLKKVCLTSFLVIILLTPNSTVFAAISQNLTLPELQSFGFSNYETINANSFFYQLKRFSEKLEPIFQKNQTKYKLSIYQKRFNELVYIANFRKTGFLDETSSRYTTISGEIIQNYKFKDHNFQAKIPKNIMILEKLRDGFEANSVAWIKLQQVIETTKGLL